MTDDRLLFLLSHRRLGNIWPERNGEWANVAINAKTEDDIPVFRLRLDRDGVPVLSDEARAAIGKAVGEA